MAGPLSTRIASYQIEARLDDEEHVITGRETLRWTHTGAEPVGELPLHLYMNAFKNEDSLFMRESGGRHRDDEKKPDDWGWIEVPSIRLGGAELRPAATYGADETLLTVALPAPAAPGSTVELEIEFTVKLPEVFARTGYKGRFTMAGQWFPKVGVLVVADGRQRWEAAPFHMMSEFFADFGVYDVTLDVPDTHVVAATGVLTAAVGAGEGRRRLTYHAEDVHDFAWMADPFMQVARTTTADGVEIRVYHRPEQARFAGRHLEAARRAIEGYGELFFPYPFAIMSVVDVPPDAGGAGGMEYPTLVTTLGDSVFLPRGVWLAEMVTLHEVGHNWFQGVVASNEVEEAWLDEGVNEYVSSLLLERWLGEDRSAIDLGGLRLGYMDSHRPQYRPDRAPTPIATPSHGFPGFGEYGAVTYSKTAEALRTLERAVGTGRFLAALGGYARRHAFGHPTERDLVQALEEQLGEDLDWFLGPALHGTGAGDYRLGKVEARRVRPSRGVFGEGDGRRTVADEDAPEGDEWMLEAVVQNVGQVPAPVEVELAFADGTRRRETWDGRGPFHRIEARHPARPVEVRLDPDGDLALDAERADNWRRLQPSRRGAWRAASRVAFWEQTLLQVVGL